MKRSRLSYDEWKCIISKDIFGKTVNSDLLNGYIGLIDIKALSKKDITKEQFNLAVETSHRLQRGMLSNISSFMEYTKMCYEMIKELRER